METTAKVTAKGQVTIPKSVRDALGLRVGDTLVFRVDGKRAIVATSDDLLDYARSVTVPAAKRGTGWDEVRRVSRRKRGAPRA